MVRSHGVSPGILEIPGRLDEASLRMPSAQDLGSPSLRRGAEEGWAVLLDDDGYHTGFFTPQIPGVFSPPLP
jgi:hypothetical protein